MSSSIPIAPVTTAVDETGSPQIRLRGAGSIVEPGSAPALRASWWSPTWRWFVGVTMPAAIKGYRGDVDGMRAVAVMSVVLYHLSARLVPGGFIGVDIFFVISGYLISGILYKELATGRFSFAEFYGRRIRRLGPALIVLLLACLAFGWFFLLGDEYKSLGRHTAVSSIFGSNILLFREVDYFGVAAEEKPHLHLWSLGIEEQFYLLWPLMLWLVWKRVPRLTWLLTAGIALSFAACVVTTPLSPSAAFYLPHTRYWELLVGALIAYRERRPLPGGPPIETRALVWSGPGVNTGLAWAGLGLIVFALYGLDRYSTFPGWWAAVPVAGAAALITAGPNTWVNRALLGNGVMTSVGALAYPIYLWHWPLFVFVLLGGGGRLIRVMALVATMVLAWLTKVVVEDPLRFGAWSKGARRQTTAVALWAALVVVGVAGLITDRADGFLSRYAPELQPLAGHVSASPETPGDPAPRCFLTWRELPDSFPAACAGPAAGGGGTLVWGDSFAYHLDSGVRRLASERGFALAEYSAAACPPIVDPQSELRRGCPAFNDFVFGRLKELHFATVVLAANWMLYSEDLSRQVERTVRAIKAAGVRHVILAGPIPSWPSALPGMLARAAMLSGANTVPPRLGMDSLASTLVRDRVMRDLAAREGADYISMTDILCGDGRTCLTLVPNAGMTPMQIDTAHLTPEGSVYVVRELADRVTVP